MKEKNHLFIFITITFVFSVLLSLLIGLTGGHESKFIWLQVCFYANSSNSSAYNEQCI
jgi:hypothetical protein